MTGASLEVVGVTVRYVDRVVLDGVSLTVESGDTIALLGPSGSGKSTLLKVIAGIVRPVEGRIRVAGADVTDTPTHLRRVGMVFQDNQLFPHRSVVDNVAFGLQMQGVDRRVRRERANEWLERVGLAGFGDRDVGTLSGGEAKRVALARTMITEPVVVLLDEPLTGLDRDLHDRLAIDLRAVLSEADTTAVLVTHDRAEAATVAARTVDLHELGGETNPRLRVVELRPADTHDLRRRVLRASMPAADVVFDGDEIPTTVHLGIISDDTVVAVSTWLQAPLPDRPGAAAVQLRGMATDPTMQGRGAGTTLLEAGVERARAAGAELVWARARSTALAFYLAHGFVTVGDEFVDAATRLPHIVVVRRFDIRS
jgi:thiamine transport system ATP-binding protein